MDKLLEFTDYVANRFTCECLLHVMDISYEHDDKGFWMLTFECAPVGSSDRTLWERIKIAWSYLTKRGKHSFWGFHLRQEDAPDFVNMMCSTLHYPNTK